MGVSKSPHAHAQAKKKEIGAGASRFCKPSRIGYTVCGSQITPSSLYCSLARYHADVLLENCVY
jgi:hypothetical protein